MKKNDINQNNTSFDDSEIKHEKISTLKYILAIVSFIVLISFIVMTCLGKTVLHFDKISETATTITYFSNRESLEFEDKKAISSESTEAEGKETTSGEFTETDDKKAINKKSRSDYPNEENFIDIETSTNEEVTTNHYDHYDYSTSTAALQSFEKSDKYSEKSISENIDNHDEIN